MIPVYLDTETTANTKNEPIEISYIGIIPDGQFEVQTYLKPVEPCLPCALAVHGLSDDFLSDKESITTGLEDTTKQLLDNQDKYCIIGYNVQFDIDVINAACMEYIDKRYKPSCYIDVMKIAKKLIPHDDVGGYSLDAVFLYLFRAELEYLLKARESHSALVDCELTRKIFKALVKKAFPEKVPNLEGIMKYTEAPMIIEKWPFGKHRGDLVEKVVNADSQYVKWFLLKAEASFREGYPDLVHTLRTKHGYS